MAKGTPAATAMQRSGRPFELLEYDYDPDAASIGLQAAEALGLPPSVVFKTLMVETGAGACVAVVPSDRELNLKALAAAAGCKSAAMIRPADAERISGYCIGGISPLGQKKRLRCFIDVSASDLPFMVVNGGRRGLQIKATPSDLTQALGATVAQLATPAKE
jgi:Cys-tRNA(Pro)/Cys-tRNA(Cys) deacylase